MATRAIKAAEIEREWRVIDAAEQPLGRLASQVAQLLRGKHKVIFTPHLDTGDYVVVVNAANVKVTGQKLKQKMYYHHTGYPSGLRSVSLGELLARRPERVIEHAVRGMLPHNKLGEFMFKKLKVYAGADHPHAAQLRGQERRRAKPATNAAPVVATPAPDLPSTDQAGSEEA